MEKRTLKRVVLSQRHKPTGKTRHYIGIEPLSPPVSLEIVKYSEAEGCYLLYLDGSGHEQTDTWHASMRAAIEQAEWEFGVTEDEWESVEPAV